MHAHGVEIHRSHRAGWLRAAVLGANDGIVSTASLVLGVAAAEAGRNGVLTAGELAKFSSKLCQFFCAVSRLLLQVAKEDGEKEKSDN